MADLSAFTLGLFDLTAETSLGEQIYDAIWDNLNAGRDNFAKDHGPIDAWVYATAMGLARLQAAIGVAGDQIDPAKILDLLPARETEFDIVVPSSATIADRRKTLAAAMRAAAGCTYGNLRQALADTLGSDFLALHVTDHADAVVWPSSPGSAGNFVDVSVPRKLATTTAPISVGLGSSQVVHVAMADGSPAFLTGDHVEIADVDVTRCESCLVEDVGTNTITLTPQNPHASGTAIVTQPFPFWTSTKRRYLVILTDVAAADAERRRLANNVMRKMVRGVSTWGIVGASAGSTTTGPFKVGGGANPGRLNVTPIGAVTI